MTVENEVDKLKKTVGSHKKLFIFGGIAIVVLIILIVIGVLLYFFYFRNTTTISKEAKHYIIKTPSDPNAQYITSEDNSSLINSISSDHNSVNAILSKNGNYVLYIDNNGSIAVLKKEILGNHSLIKEYYTSTSTGPQPFVLKAYNRVDNPTSFDTNTLVNFIVYNDTPIPIANCSPIYKLGQFGDGHNFGMYVSDTGLLMVRIYTTAFNDTTPIKDYQITSFISV